METSGYLWVFVQGTRFQESGLCKLICWDCRNFYELHLYVNRDVSDDSEAEGQGTIVKEVEKEISRVEKVTSQDVPSKQFPLDSDTGYTGVQASVVLDWDSGDEKANNGDPLMDNGVEVEEVCLL
jgi:hypothetical protein